MKQNAPIEVFYWTTPNGRKITVMLEELAVPYTVNFVNINKREQWTPEFGAISPHHQIPAIRDPEGPGDAPIALFESGAIMLYLARKFGRLYPRNDERRCVEVDQWLMWQVGNFGPFLGQAHHFNLSAAEEVPYAIERYAKITARLYDVLNDQLTGSDYVAGAYSIADIAIYCWVARYLRHRVDLADYPAVKRWFDALSARPAVQRGMAVTKPGHVDVPLPPAAWKKSS